MKQSIRSTALALVAALGLTVLLPGIAEAGSKGRRNTAIALGAVSIYGIAKKKPLIAGLAGGGAVYSYVRSRQAARKERQRRHFRSRRARGVWCARHHRYHSHRH